MANLRLPRLADLKDPKKRLKFLLIGGAFALIIIFINAIMLPATSNPKFCGLACHSMKREYYTWQKSSHSNITCTACHVEQGLIPFFHEKAVEGPLGLIAELTNDFEHPTNKESRLGFEHISRATCERCHNLKQRNVTPNLLFKDNMVGSGEAKYHAKHLKKGMSCTLCHNRITHKDVNKPSILKKSGYSENNAISKVKYKDGMSMTEGCFRCHSPFEKERDHELIEKYKADDAPKTCNTCHPKKMLPMGHGEDWTITHPDAARKAGFKFCWKCHDKGKRFQAPDGKRSRCRDCHHRILAKKTLALDSCEMCHEEMAETKESLVAKGVKAKKVENNLAKAQYFRRMAYHKVHFPKKFKCTKCHLSDLETTKKATFELCKNEGCHPPGQVKPPSGSKLCKQCHFSPHN